MKNTVDAHVGMRVRYRRRMQGMTQQTLATAIGIKFQQVQKYETGTNRISASRLWDIARVLDVSVGFFFVGLDTTLDTGGTDEDRDQMPVDPLADREALEVLRAYYSTPQVQRRPLLALLRASGTKNDPDGELTVSSGTVYGQESQAEHCAGGQAQAEGNRSAHRS